MVLCDHAGSGMKWKEGIFENFSSNWVVCSTACYAKIKIDIVMFINHRHILIITNTDLIPLKKNSFNICISHLLILKIIQVFVINKQWILLRNQDRYQRDLLLWNPNQIRGSVLSIMIGLVRLSAFQVRIFLNNQSNRCKYIIILIVDSSFVRNEPARKSGGFLKNLIKKSFGKGRLKKDRKSRHDSGATGISDTSSGNNFIENPVRLPTSQHPPHKHRVSCGTQCPHLWVTKSSLNTKWA